MDNRDQRPDPQVEPDMGGDDAKGSQRQQLHVWITADELGVLRKAAVDADRSISSLIRSLIRGLKRR